MKEYLLLAVFVLFAMVAIGYIEHRSTGNGVNLNYGVPSNQAPTLIFSTPGNNATFGGGPMSSPSASLISPSVGQNAQVLYNNLGYL